jgi:ankyrin repeat protein
MNNFEDTPQSSRASGQTQTGSSDTTIFEPSPPKRARTGENITAHTVSQIQTLPSGSLEYKASGLKNTLHGDIYQLKLLMLFLERGLSKGYSFRLATEMDDAEKFDDLVFRYVENGSEVIRFLQAKHKQDQATKISKSDLLNEKDGDFSLQKYFISYRKITQNPAFNGAVCKDFIIFTNIDLNDRLYDWFEPIGGTDPILSMTWENPQNRTAKLLRMNLTDLKGDREKLLDNLRNASDLHRLANKISDCALGKKKPLNLNDNLLKTYHEALAQNVIDIETKRYKSSFINGDASLTEFRALLNKDKLSEDDFRNKLTACVFNIEGNFGKPVNPKQFHSLPDGEINPAEVMGFLKKLVLAVNQPNETELWGIIKSEIREFHNINLNDMDLMASEFQTKMLDWMKKKEGSFLTKENGHKLVNVLTQKVVKLMFAGITKDHCIKLENIGITFVSDQAELEAFLINPNEKLIFNLIVKGKANLGSLMVHQTMKNSNGFDYLNDDSCIFVSLSCLSRLKVLVREAFQSTKLLVVEFEDLQEDMLQELFDDFCAVLESHSDKKLVLITHESDLSKSLFPFKTNRQLRDRYEQKTVKFDFTDLTTMSQEKLSIRSRVIFQGHPVSLADLISRYGENLTHAIDEDILQKIIDNKEILIGKPLPSLGEVQNYYIPRTLLRAVRIRPDFEKGSSSLIIRNISDASNVHVNKGEIQKKSIVVISDSSNVFDQLHDNHKYNECNIHWLREDKNVLKWHRTRGEISGLRDSIMTEYHDEMSMSQIRDKLVIMSSEPGMGKSTLMTDIANNTKKKYPTAWIIRINLNDCTTDLEAIDGDIDKFKAVEFLLRTANIESDFEIAFFKHIIEIPGCVALNFDGFDEISPHYKQKVLDLILAYHNTKKVCICITTRPHLKQELEDKFGTFAYTLKPLNKGGQESLIKGFWNTKIGHKIPPNKAFRIEQYVKEILKLFTQSIADSNKTGMFSGIPLQTVLLAEYFYDNVKDFYTSENTSLLLPSSLNALDLYAHFIQKKYHIYCEEKKRQDRTIVANIVDDIVLSKHFMDRHEVYALNALFGEKTAKSLLMMKDQKGAIIGNEIAEGMERTGIILEIVNGIPIFIHRTFAEYFAAAWFAKHISDLETKKLLRKVLFTDENGLLRNFFDRMLCKENFKLHNAVLNGDKKKINELLLGPCVEIHIKAVDKGGRTALHLAAACGDNDVVNMLLSRGADASVHDGLFGWSAAVYADRCTMLHLAIFLLKKMTEGCQTRTIIDKYDTLIDDPRRRDFYTSVLGYYISLITPETENSLLNAAVKYRDLQFVEYLLQNGFFSNVVNRFGKTAFQDAVLNDRKHIVQCLLEFYSRSLSSLRASELGKYQKKLRKFLNVQDINGNNSLCVGIQTDSKDVCKYLIEIYLENLSQLKQNDPFSYFNELEVFYHWKNNDGDTPFSLAIVHGSFNCFKLWMRNFFDCMSELKAVSFRKYSNQIDGFCKTQNKKGVTLQHLLVSSVSFHNSEVNVKFFKHLTDSYSDALVSLKSSDRKLYQNKLLQFLNAVDNEGNTPLCLASKLNYYDMCEYLIQKNLQTIFPLKEENIDAYRDGLRMLFHHSNYDGDTPIALACANGNLNCVKLWTSTFDCQAELKAVSTEQYFNQIHDFVSSKNKNGLTPLHLAAQRYQLSIVKCLAEFYSDTVNPADSKSNRDKFLAFLNPADNHGNTPLCLASTRFVSDLCDYLISQHLSTLLPLEAENRSLYRAGLRKLFYHTNFNGDTPLALACATDRRNCIEVWIRRHSNYSSYLKTTEDESKAEVETRYLNTKNKDGMTPIDLAKCNGKYFVINGLIQS